MLNKILNVAGKSDAPLHLLQFVLSPFLQIGTKIDSFFVSDNFSLFKLNLKSLWISERIALPSEILPGFGGDIFTIDKIR